MPADYSNADWSESVANVFTVQKRFKGVWLIQENLELLTC